jgi:hypothetical protein
MEAGQAGPSTSRGEAYFNCYEIILFCIYKFRNLFCSVVKDINYFLYDYGCFVYSVVKDI